MTSQLFPTKALVILGVIAIGLIVYVNPSFEMGEIINLNQTSWDFPEINIQITNDTFANPLVQTIPSKNDPPYFKTFPEELSWYSQFDSAITIAETNCDKLVRDYRIAEFDSKVAYSKRILEVCEI